MPTAQSHVNDGVSEQGFLHDKLTTLFKHFVIVAEVAAELAVSVEVAVVLEAVIIKHNANEMHNSRTNIIIRQ